MKIDHVAVVVNNVHESACWYSDRFNAHIDYEDETWAMLDIGGSKLALVLKAQHNSHIAIRVDTLSEFPDGCEIKTHRDGSWYFYDTDPSGNTVEWIKYDD
jgi:extradiol dioxygenase family protein